MLITPKTSIWLGRQHQAFWFLYQDRLLQPKFNFLVYFKLKAELEALKSLLARRRVLNRYKRFLKFRYQGRHRFRYWKRRRMKQTRLLWFEYSRIWRTRVYSELAFTRSYRTYKIFTPIVYGSSEEIVLIKDVSFTWYGSYILHFTIFFLMHLSVSLDDLIILCILLRVWDLDLFFSFLYTKKKNILYLK